MKKTLILCCFAAFTLTAGAQTTSAEPVVAASKEEKARQKEQQEADLLEAFKAAGLTDAQMASVRETLEAASKAGKDLKADATLSEEQKVEAKKKINADKNARLKEIMGAEAYRSWNEIRRQQKARAGSTEPAAQ